MNQYSLAVVILLVGTMVVLVAVRHFTQRHFDYESERTLTRFLTKSHSGVVAVSDVQGTILASSETFDRQFKSATTEDDLPASVLDTLDSESRYNYCNIIKHAFRTDNPVRNFRVTTVADGNRRQMLLTVVPVRTARGRCAGLINILDNPDKLTEVSADFEHLEKLTNVGQIAAGIAHGLNTPLGAIILSADIIAEMETSNQSQEEARKIKDQASHCSRVVKELLRYVKKEQRTKRRCGMKTIIERVRDLLEPELKERNIVLDISIKTEDDAIFCDENQMEQLFINLFSNAFHAIDNGGRITVTVNQDALLNQLIVTFADNGRGIDPRDMTRIFEPFFTTKPGVKGTGLGLALCKRIALEHDGGIEARSVLGEGATFVLRFPVA